MKTIAQGLVIAVLLQTVAQAQVFDLPELDTGNPTAYVPAPPFDMSEPKYAGSLRLEKMSRKDDGTEYKVLFAAPSRLLKLDVRVAFGKVRLSEAFLVTESGNRIEVQNYRATGVLDTATLNSSENFSLNENITEVILSAEAFSDDAQLILTAVSESSIPQLSLAPPEAVTTSPSLIFPKEFQTPEASATVSGDCFKGYCVGDVVIFQRQRAKITKIYSDGRVSLIQRGVRKILTSVSEIKRPLVPPYSG